MADEDQARFGKEPRPNVGGNLGQAAEAALVEMRMDVAVGEEAVGAAPFCSTVGPEMPCRVDARRCYVRIGPSVERKVKHGGHLDGRLRGHGPQAVSLHALRSLSIMGAPSRGPTSTPRPAG